MIPSIQNITNKRKCRSISSFLKKTFDLLNDDQNLNVVRWASNGIGFIVVSEEEFAKTVLPKYFKHSNYSSFVRQLNMYNFHKIRETNSESYFHHQHFDRNDKNALAEIKRKPQKKKRKQHDDQDSQGQERDSQTFKKCKNKENSDGKMQKSEEMMNESLSKMISEDDGSFKTIRKYKVGQNSTTTTKQLFSSVFTLKFQNPSSESNSVKKIEENIWQGDQNDDKISINDQIQERIIPIPFPTKELMYPSKHNLIPFRNKESENFNIFF